MLDFKQIEIGLLELQVGEFFGGFTLVKRSPKRITLQNDKGQNTIINIKTSEHGFKYLDCKRIKQILRDIEGHLIMQIHSNTQITLP